MTAGCVTELGHLDKVARKPGPFFCLCETKEKGDQVNGPIVSGRWGYNSHDEISQDVSKVDYAKGSWDKITIHKIFQAISP